MKQSPVPEAERYASLFSELSQLLDSARRASVRAVNFVMTGTYWGLGRRIVEFEQRGQKRAGYGEELLVRWPEIWRPDPATAYRARSHQSDVQPQHGFPRQTRWSQKNSASISTGPATGRHGYVPPLFETGVAGIARFPDAPMSTSAAVKKRSQLARLRAHVNLRQIAKLKAERSA